MTCGKQIHCQLLFLSAAILLTQNDQYMIKLKKELKEIYKKSYYYTFFIRKPFFYLGLSFLNIMLEIRLRFSHLTFISLFCLML